MGIFSAWRSYRMRQHLKTEAKQLIAEAKRILRKKKLRIPDTVKDVVSAHIAVVDATRASGSIEEFNAAVRALDGSLSEHLAFARKSQARQYVESISVALGVALLLRAFVVEAFQIPSGSMIPTLEVGDHIFVSKFSYSVGIPFSNTKILKLGDPKRGDVIVFKFPPDQDPSKTYWERLFGQDYIKRVVGLPGETIEIRKNEVFINSRPMPRQKASGGCLSQDSDDALPKEFGGCELWTERLDGKEHSLHQNGLASPMDYGPRTIPEGNYFVMGDNRDNSKDSRYWGFVPFEFIKGRALVIWWSRDPSKGESWLDSVKWRRFGRGVD